MFFRFTMVAVIIMKKTLTLIILGILAVVLLGYGLFSLKEDDSAETTTEKETETTTVEETTKKSGGFLERKFILCSFTLS